MAGTTVGRVTGQASAPEDSTSLSRDIADRRWRGWAPVAGVLVVAAAVRLWLLTTRAMELDADEAVTGIMVRRILDGHHTAYYAGQDYMGTLEQYLQAAVLAVLPDTDFVLRLPQVALAVVSCLLVHRIALRAGLSAQRALLAAGMFAVGPYFLVYWGTKSRGGYAAAMVLALVGLLLALSTRSDDPHKAARAAAFGLVAGLAFWINQQAAYLLLPAAWWLWAYLRDRPARHAGIAAGAFLVGTIPALWRTVDTGAPLLAAVGGDSHVGDRMHHLFTEKLPAFLGARDDSEALFPWLPPMLVVVVAVVTLAVAVVRRRDGLRAILTLRTTGRDGIDLLLAVLCIVPVLAALSGGSVNATARFLFVIYPVVLVLLAATPVPRRVRGSWVPHGAALLAVVLLAAHTWIGSRWHIAEDDGGRPDVREHAITDEDVEAIVGALRTAGAETAYADYWLAHPLNWELDGEVLVESVAQRRFPHISAAVSEGPAPALIVSEDEIADLRRVLEERGVRFDAVHVLEWWVVFDLSPPVHPAVAPTVAVGIVWAE